MSLSQLLAMRGSMPKSLSMDLSPKALELWKPELRVEASAEEATISIMDVIGYDYWTGEGVTAKRIAGALRSIGSDKPVTVYINSPGGDMFEGLAINSLLNEHKGQVTVKVLALAASAASVIAMGADKIEIARGAFFMIHNAWVVAAGNRNDLRDVADWLQPFDSAMADIYAERTGLDVKDIAKMMDKETWLGGQDSVDKGFADAITETATKDAGTSASALRRMDVALARTGMTRTDRRELINEFKASMSGAAGLGTPGATDTPPADFGGLKLDLGLGQLSKSLVQNLR